jgi:hypothetical protein
VNGNSASAHLSPLLLLLLFSAAAACLEYYLLQGQERQGRLPVPQGQGQRHAGVIHLR